ncbi:hypothetical protein ACNKHT_10530 [Shigella flexneri]
MINKEAVKQRLNREDEGIPFTYLPTTDQHAYHFACPIKQYGVVLQIGGSDQWWYITSGIDLTRRLNDKQVFGMTVPYYQMRWHQIRKTRRCGLVGSEENEPVHMYQFSISTADADVYRFLILHLYEH